MADARATRLSRKKLLERNRIRRLQRAFKDLDGMLDSNDVHPKKRTQKQILELAIQFLLKEATCDGMDSEQLFDELGLVPTPPQPIAPPDCGDTYDYRQVFLAGHYATLVISMDNTIIDLNRASEALIGMERRQLLSTPVFSYMVPDKQTEEDLRVFMAAMLSGACVITTCTMQLPDGTVLPITSYNRLLFGPDGVPTCGTAHIVPGAPMPPVLHQQAPAAADVPMLRSTGVTVLPQSSPQPNVPQAVVQATLAALPVVADSAPPPPSYAAASHATAAPQQQRQLAGSGPGGAPPPPLPLPAFTAEAPLPLPGGDVHSAAPLPLPTAAAHAGLPPLQGGKEEEDVFATVARLASETLFPSQPFAASAPVTAAPVPVAIPAPVNEPASPSSFAAVVSPP